MAKITPAGPESLALENLKTLLCNCGSFQTWVGVDEDSDDKDGDAAEFVFYVDAPAGTTRPFAIIDVDGGGTRNGIALGVSEMRAKLRVQFQEDIDAEAENDGDAYIRFANSIGAIVADMYDLGTSGGYLNVLSIARDGKPGRPELPEGVTRGQDYYWDDYTVEYMGA